VTIPTLPSRGPLCSPAARRLRTARGFTLIEVLVALSIVALALMAGIQATSALAGNAMRQSDALLAQICAENEQVKIRLSRQMPGLGDTSVDCEQAGRHFTSTVSIQATPNPNFRRVDVRVTSENATVLQLSSVIGSY
jgi:general secretion pathway protein I